jgi:hypothetical protein
MLRHFCRCIHNTKLNIINDQRGGVNAFSAEKCVNDNDFALQYEQIQILVLSRFTSTSTGEVWQNQVSSGSIYIQVIPGRGAWPDLPDCKATVTLVPGTCTVQVNNDTKAFFVGTSTVSYQGLEKYYRLP